MNEYPEGRSVHFRPAFDRRHPEPSKNYGVHGVEIVLVVRHGRCGVDWTIFSNWQLPHVVEETVNKHADSPYHLKLFMCPSGAQVGFHSPTPAYEGHEKSVGCTITGGDCYGDVGFTMGDKLMPILIEKGEDAVWARLEELLADYAPQAAGSAQ